MAKRAKNLTVDAVERAKPRDKPYTLRDGKITGLLLRVQPSGVKAYYADYRVNGRRTSKRIGDADIKTLAQARTEAKEILLKADKGIDAHAEERRQKAEALGDYLKTTYQPYAEQHIKSHADIMPRLKNNFGNLYKKSLTEISELDIERWRRKKAKEDKPVTFETLQREFTYLKSALNHAVKTFKLIPSHQLEKYTLKRRTNDSERSNEQTIRYLSPDEEKRLRAALNDRETDLRHDRDSANTWRRERGYDQLKPLNGLFVDHIKPIVLLALNTGLRRGDLFDLDWKHIDFQQRQICKVIAKTSRTNSTTPAVLPLSDEAVIILREWQRMTQDAGLVFPSPVTGQRLNNITKAWRGVVKDAAIANFRFHDLRHTFASKLVMGGVDLNTVRELMCHADIKMTLIYAHLSPDHKAEAIRRVFSDATMEAS